MSARCGVVSAIVSVVVHRVWWGSWSRAPWRGDRTRRELRHVLRCSTGIARGTRWILLRARAHLTADRNFSNFARTTLGKGEGDERYEYKVDSAINMTAKRTAGAPHQLHHPRLCYSTRAGTAGYYMQGARISGSSAQADCPWGSGEGGIESEDEDCHTQEAKCKH